MARRKKHSNEYLEHLRSERWKFQRRAMLWLANGTCQVCGAGDKELHVHHKSYKTLGHETPADLIVLCADCHAKFHQKLEEQARGPEPDPAKIYGDGAPKKGVSVVANIADAKSKEEKGRILFDRLRKRFANARQA